jgi:hypothetical protein
MGACLCRVLGCPKKETQTENPAPDTSLKDVDLYRVQLTKSSSRHHARIPKKSSVSNEMDLPEVSLSNVPIIMQSSIPLAPFMLRSPSLRLQFTWMGKLSFEQEVKVKWSY